MCHLRTHRFTHKHLQSCPVMLWGEEGALPQAEPQGGRDGLSPSHRTIPRSPGHSERPLCTPSIRDAGLCFLFVWCSQIADSCLNTLLLLFIPSVVSDSVNPWTAAHQASCPSPSSGPCSNSCWWFCPTISSSVTPFSSCLQSFPASRSFPLSQLFASGGQSITASASVLPMNIQSWFPLEFTGLISLLSRRLFKNFVSLKLSR